jgi:hypothetical protein
MRKHKFLDVELEIVAPRTADAPEADGVIAKAWRGRRGGRIEPRLYHGELQVLV